MQDDGANVNENLNGHLIYCIDISDINDLLHVYIQFCL